jgi:hypothetical protein
MGQVWSTGAEGKNIMIRHDPVEVPELSLMLYVLGNRIKKFKYGKGKFYLQETPCHANLIRTRQVSKMLSGNKHVTQTVSRGKFSATSRKADDYGLDERQGSSSSGINFGCIQGTN